MTAIHRSRQTMRFTPSKKQFTELGRRLARGDAEASPASAVVQWSFAIVAGLLLWILAFGTVFSGLVEHHLQHNLYVSLRQNLFDGVVPVGAPIAEGAPIALINGPAGGIHQVVVVQGTSAGDLRAGPGHYPGSPLPGQPGGALIFGRSVSYGGPFADIGHFHAGDKITVTTGQGVFTFLVEDVRRAGDPIPSALPAGGSQLTLETSEGSGWRSGWAPSHTLWVDAILQGKAAQAAPVAATSSADQAMATDSSGLFQVVLWLQLLVFVVVVIVVLRRRWGGWQLWLIAMPITVASLWGLSNAAWPLLPNLL
jgi:sortase A